MFLDIKITFTKCFNFFHLKFLSVFNFRILMAKNAYVICWANASGNNKVCEKYLKYHRKILEVNSYLCVIGYGFHFNYQNIPQLLLYGEKKNVSIKRRKLWIANGIFLTTSFCLSVCICLSGYLSLLPSTLLMWQEWHASLSQALSIGLILDENSEIYTWI